MPLNAINYVLTKSVLDRAIGDEPTPEQTSEINRSAAISAFVPGTLGLAVPFITRDRIVGDKDEEEEETGIEASTRVASNKGRLRRTASATSQGGTADRFTRRFTRRSTNQLADRLADRSADKAEAVIVDVANRASQLMGKLGNQLSAITINVDSINTRLDAIDVSLQANSDTLTTLGNQVSAVEKDVAKLKSDIATLKGSKTLGS